MRITATLSDQTILEELGHRAQQHRVGLNLTQGQLADAAGVSQRTVERLEGGNPLQLDKMLRILRALRIADNLDALIPETVVRPLQLAVTKAKVRKRASTRGQTAKRTAGWVWGDQK